MLVQLSAARKAHVAIIAAVVRKYSIDTASFFLALSLLDRVYIAVAKRLIPVSSVTDLTILTLVCLLLACKYENRQVLKFKQAASAHKETEVLKNLTSDQVMKAENLILSVV